MRAKNHVEMTVRFLQHFFFFFITQVSIHEQCVVFGTCVFLAAWLLQASAQLGKSALCGLCAF